MSERGLAVVVIYDNPSDYPGKYVVRRQWAIQGGGIVIEDEPLAVVDSLARARDKVPAQQDWRMSRALDDDPTIVECWI